MNVALHSCLVWRFPPVLKTLSNTSCEVLYICPPLPTPSFVSLLSFLSSQDCSQELNLGWTTVPYVIARFTPLHQRVLLLRPQSFPSSMDTVLNMSQQSPEEILRFF